MNDSLMRVYFDYNATTPLAPEVLEAVVRATRDQFGNASSVHHFGQQAKGSLTRRGLPSPCSSAAIRRKWFSPAEAPNRTISPFEAQLKRSNQPAAATSSRAR